MADESDGNRRHLSSRRLLGPSSLGDSSTDAEAAVTEERLMGLPPTSAMRTSWEPCGRIHHSISSTMGHPCLLSFQGETEIRREVERKAGRQAGRQIDSEDRLILRISYRDR